MFVQRSCMAGRRGWWRGTGPGNRSRSPGGTVTLSMVFEGQDLQRVRLAAAADPLWELVLGVQKLQLPRVPVPLAGWRQDCARRLDGRRAFDAVALVRTLVPARGAFPDLLTPPESAAGLDAGCEAVLCAPRNRVCADLAAVFAGRTAPAWARSFALGDRDAKRDLVQALRTAHALLVEPRWAEVRKAVAADHAARTRDLASHGVHALLANLPGVVSWDGRVLRTGYPVDRTVHLRGRGLVLQPSYFCLGNPVTWLDPELPPVLVFQVLGHRTPVDVTVPERLVALLGRTRAECLRALLSPLTTTELAERLGTSVGTASKQATVLRETGLVVSDRRGVRVLHSTTTLGLTLLVDSPADR
jgi:DNA-binding transcriptional ArsR family regulator